MHFYLYCDFRKNRVDTPENQKKKKKKKKKKNLA